MGAFYGEVSTACWGFGGGFFFLNITEKSMANHAKSECLLL